MLRVKLVVYYTVSFKCNIHFLNSTYFIFNHFKSNKFSRFFCCWVYMICTLKFQVHYITCTLNLHVHFRSLKKVPNTPFSGFLQ